MASDRQFGITVVTIALLWISCVRSESCGIACVECLPDRQCHTCSDGYFIRNNKCAKCFEGCSKCVDTFYGCSQQCKPGRWGKACQYSCTSCSECVNDLCKEACIDYVQSSLNYKRNIVCLDQKCSFRFSGPRKSDTVFSTIQTNVRIRPTQTRTQPPTRTRRTLPPTRTRRTLPPTRTRRTLPQTTTLKMKMNTSSRSTMTIATQDPQTKSTTHKIWTNSNPTRTSTEHTETQLTTIQPKTMPFIRYVTTSYQSDGKVYYEQPGEVAKTNREGITEQTESQRDGLDSTVGYIVTAAVSVLVLTVATIIVVVVCIKRRKSRQDQVICPQDANNKAESRQLTDNPGLYSNVYNQAATNVAVNDTGYVT